MKKLLLTIALLYIGFSAFCQEEKTTIAIFPFTSSLPANRPFAIQVQEMVLEILKTKASIQVIDRSKDSLLLKELNAQMREESVSANGLVAQGKIAGAKQLIAGTVTNVRVTQNNTTNPYNKGASATTSYSAAVNLSMQLIDVETGTTLSQKTFDSKEGGGFFVRMSASNSTSPDDALRAAVKIIKKEVIAWINLSYPPDVKILSVDSRNGRGFPATVLVSGVDASLPVGTKLDVNEIQKFDAGGKMLTRVRKIAALKIKEYQGEITLCQVTDGENTLEEKIKPPAKIAIVAK
jgi:hypothetical protein